MAKRPCVPTLVAVMTLAAAGCGTASTGGHRAIVNSPAPGVTASSTVAPATSVPAEVRTGPPAVPPQPCPPHPTEPSFGTTYCGPMPGPGDGLGPSGECTGQETTPPCGPGMVPDRYYAYTLPGRCDGRLIVNGSHWRSELPPAMPVADLYGWVRITADGRHGGWMGPQGAIGIDPEAGQPPTPCTLAAPPTTG